MGYKCHFPCYATHTHRLNNPERTYSLFKPISIRIC